MEAIKKFLSLNETKSIYVSIVGDCMVDEYYAVNADKISPEFPIIRMLSESGNHTALPGGASNVAMMFGDFNVKSCLFGLIDNYSQKIFENNGLSTSHCFLMPPTGQVPVKKRFYHGEFPLCRWDVEKTNYFGEEWGTKIILEEHQRELYDMYVNYTLSDVVILSDYNKGVFTGNKKRWMRDDKPVIVDPKKGPIESWDNCYIFKPNAKEAKELSGGISGWKEQCQYFYKTLRCKAVVITQGEHGAVGIIDGKFFEYRPLHLVVADSLGYSGAGDCFNAFLSMCVAHGMDVYESVVVACNAASIYVTKKHNQLVTKWELLGLYDPIAVKFEMPPHNRDYKLIMTNGVFDCGLTSAHVQYLQQAKSLGDKLLVAINSDESVKRLKGDGRPIMPLDERMKVVAGLGCVDFVISFDEDTPLSVIKKINPSIVTKGGDYKPEEVVGYGVVDVVVLNKFESMSTTEKIKKTIDNKTEI